MKRIFAALLILVMLSAACIGHAQSDFSVCFSTSLAGASEAQVSNIRRAIAKINGAHIPSGGSFSFNETVGPRTKAYGYQSAENGRGADVTGGGVAQAAATMYLALSEYGAQVQYKDLKFYGSKFTGSYTDAGSAVMLDYSSGIDFAFTNLGGDMDVQMWISGGELFCGLTIAEENEVETFSWYIATESAGREAIASASLALGRSEAANNNVRLAAASINDTVLPAGEVFSFNDTVGPRTEKNGFQAADNGRGVRVTGGGVAQVASVMWLAIKNCDDVTVVEKSTYGSKYNQDYVASSNDAILVDHKGGTDFTFRNTSDAPITICTYISGGSLICEIYKN